MAPTVPTAPRPHPHVLSAWAALVSVMAFQRKEAHLPLTTASFRGLAHSRRLVNSAVAMESSQGLLWSWTKSRAWALQTLHPYSAHPCTHTPLHPLKYSSVLTAAQESLHEKGSATRAPQGPHLTLRHDNMLLWASL